MALIKVVPDAQRRILHIYDKGNDVEAFQRMLSRELKLLKMVPTNTQNGTYGRHTLVDTMRLQHAKGIVPSGRVGTLTWQAVDPQMKSYERWLLRKKPPPVATPGQRVQHELEVMLALAPKPYSERRPGAVGLAQWKAEGGDCSDTYYNARLISGTITSWNGIGNTSTLWATGTEVSEAGLKPGDAILYGSGGVTKHVAGYDGNGYGIGHGSAGGPRRLPIRYRGDLMGFRRYWP